MSVLYVARVDDLDGLDAAPAPRLCLCGCRKPVEARPGPGRPTLYATPECRRIAEYRARKAGRDDIRPAGRNDPRDSRETLRVRVADPARLARGWFFWRYPEHYRPCDDSRNPVGFRTILSLKDYPSTTVTLYPGMTVRTIRQADIEVTELAGWIKRLPPYQQADFACRAIETIGGPMGSARASILGEVFADGVVRHDADSRPDPVTLGQLRDFYRPGECLEAGCHADAAVSGACRSCYDHSRR